MATCPDGRCDGSGFLYDEEQRRACPCTCRPALLARKRAAAVAGRIPKAFREVSFDREPLPALQRAYPHVLREVRRYCDSITEQLDAGRGMWFTGHVGTGKTTLAMLISKTAMGAERTVAIYSLPRLLATAARDVPRRRPVQPQPARWTSCARSTCCTSTTSAPSRPPPWVLEQLYTVVNTRYEDRRSLILTTNLIEPEAGGGPRTSPRRSGTTGPDAELRKQIGDRTVSRLYEMCGDPLFMFGDDRRLEARLASARAGAAAAATPDPFDDTRWEDGLRATGAASP